MRVSDAVSGFLFNYADLEKRVPADHPLRVIRCVVNAALADLSAAFDALYSPFGRESIPPERPVLQAFYSTRSERRLIERIEEAFGWAKTVAGRSMAATRRPLPSKTTIGWKPYSP